jgi:5-methylcytosine-specific restriction endonuclease McrA
MVPKLLRRLAGLSASTSGDDETLAWRRPGEERREGSVGNPLPSAWVRMHVWRRDYGRCVGCGSQERVWFDYIVPVWEGGSNTEQNIRLLCERCGREKGASRRTRRWRA